MARTIPAFNMGAKTYEIIAGVVHKKCGHCDAWHPITWGETVGHIGRLVFRANPKLGQRRANGTIDTRNPVCFPKTKRVPLCPTCSGLLDEVRRHTPTERTPFLTVDEKRLP
jgi:hypothetical protein